MAAKSKPHATGKTKPGDVSERVGIVGHTPAMLFRLSSRTLPMFPAEPSRKPAGAQKQSSVRILSPMPAWPRGHSRIGVDSAACEPLRQEPRASRFRVIGRSSGMKRDGASEPAREAIRWRVWSRTRPSTTAGSFPRDAPSRNRAPRRAAPRHPAPPTIR